MIGNNIVTNESHFGNVEERLAVVNPGVDTENNVELSVPVNLCNSCIV